MRYCFLITLAFCFHTTNAQLNCVTADLQSGKPQIFIPVEYSSCFVKRTKNPIYPGPKTLTLYSDSTFIFKDISDCSCWMWMEFKGKWYINRDTLLLDWYDKLKPYNVLWTTKYLMLDSQLIYTDPNEKNTIKNWGTFVLYNQEKTEYLISH